MKVMYSGWEALPKLATMRPAGSQNAEPAGRVCSVSPLIWSALGIPVDYGGAETADGVGEKHGVGIAEVVERETAL